MADIPSSLSKFNDQEISDNAPVSESLFYKMGQNSNFLVDFFSAASTGTATFTSTGTWVCPANVKRIVAIGIGCGGGGAGGGTFAGVAYGGGGGGSGITYPLFIEVTPGQSYPVNIGGGGGGGQPGASGGQGGDVTFANKIWAGGMGGTLPLGGRGSMAGQNGVPANLGGAGGGGWSYGGLANGGAGPAATGGGGGGGNSTVSGAMGGTGVLFIFWFTQVLPPA